LACFGAPRRLGAFMAAAYAMLMLAALGSGRLSPWLSLPLSVIYGGLRICVWAVFFERISMLGDHAASLTLILSGALQSVVFLCASAGLTELASPGGQNAAFGVALLVAV
jgi:hypothetical protein